MFEYCLRCAQTLVLRCGRPSAVRSIGSDVVGTGRAVEWMLLLLPIPRILGRLPS